MSRKRAQLFHGVICRAVRKEAQSRDLSTHEAGAEVLAIAISLLIFGHSKSMARSMVRPWMHDMIDEVVDKLTEDDPTEYDGPGSVSTLN